jgi:hypothetical protein
VSKLDPVILDAGLVLAMEWGEQWLMPIQTRLAQLHPELDAIELELYNEACGSAMRYGHDLVMEVMLRTHNEEEWETLWWTEFREAFPWASDDAMRHLYSQGRYYAWKAGG